MKHLTYADRELLLLLSEACTFARKLSPNFGFEHALTRDLAVLSRYLVQHKDKKDVAEIARGGLIYVVQAARPSPKKLGEFELLVDAFITSYAVHEIRTRLGEQAIYNPPRLTSSEQSRAENLFLEFLEKPFLDDEKLVAESRKIGAFLANLATCGLFRRLQQSIDFLIFVLCDTNRSLEHRSYARAALSYVVCEDDAIDDRSGIVGYLDDNFIAQTAVEMIEPNREPWLELLDATIGKWPFLNGLIIDDGTGGRPISEYMIINSALSCSKLRNDGDLTETLLISPITGHVPFLLGFIAALGLAHESGQHNVSEDSFRQGMKVLVDGCAIAVFRGFDTCNGRRMFKLEQYCTQNKQKLSSVHYWPVSDLRRLIPADRTLSTRGDLQSDLSRSNIPLPGLEYLFNASENVQLPSVQRRIIIVMPVVAAHEMATQMHFQNYSLKDVIPMGHLSQDEGVKRWSKRFGKQQPLIIFVTDLDSVHELVEEEPKRNQLVIVDASRRNAHKTASLQRIQRFGISTLVILTERAANELDLHGDGRVSIWEWNNNDFASLLWPEQTIKDDEGYITRHERRLQWQVTIKPEIKKVQMPLATQAFEAVRNVKSLAHARGDECPTELDDLVTLTFVILTRLLRSATKLTANIPSTIEIERNLRQLRQKRDHSIYLSESERAAISLAETSMSELFSELRRDNPKANILNGLLSAQPNLVILCPHKQLCNDLEIAFSNTTTRILYSCNADESNLEGAVVPGWFSKDRMATLLMPPVTSPIHLILYDIEYQWHKDFRREQQKSHDMRKTYGNRAKVFPNVEGWGKPIADEIDLTSTDRNTSLNELEAIQQHVQMKYREHVYEISQSDGTETEVLARLVMFEGDAYAFLTDSYKANVVTHLLDNSIEALDDQVDIRRLQPSKLKLGDALLFRRGSDRDVIRTAADELLGVGVRKTSSLWRDAIQQCLVREHITTEELWKRLIAAGCPLQHQTIRSWLDSDDTIAPQSYIRDVGFIAQVTKNQTLINHMNDVLTSINEVRSAHLRASFRLAKQVMAKAVTMLKERNNYTPFIEIEANVVVARIVAIDDQLSTVRVSLINQLLEGGQWHE
jgi:uncharacterized membrane protein YkvA (DUF1232 family)